MHLRCTSGEDGDGNNELIEINGSIAIRVENVDNSLHQRVLHQLGNRQKLFYRKGAVFVCIDLLEAAMQPPQFIFFDYINTRKDKGLKISNDTSYEPYALQWDSCKSL